MCAQTSRTSMNTLYRLFQTVPVTTCGMQSTHRGHAQSLVGDRLIRLKTRCVILFSGTYTMSCGRRASCPASIGENGSALGVTYERDCAGWWFGNALVSRNSRHQQAVAPGVR